MPQKRDRKRPVHPPSFEHGNQSILIFLTVCTKDRRKLLANDAMHEHFIHCWGKAHLWRVGRYVVMPDHVHLFCAPGTWPPTPLRQWVAFWKNQISRESGAKGLWQRDFWDRQLRNGESYSEKWHYVCRNPVRHELAEKPEDWPYQGEMNHLPWHNP